MTHPSDDTTDRARALEALDLAQRTTPFCDRCGRPMLPVSKGSSALWLECSYLQRERPRLRRILDSNLGTDHTRRIIVDVAA
jgi:hypothetical protein